MLIAIAHLSHIASENLRDALYKLLTRRGWVKVDGTDTQWFKRYKASADPHRRDRLQDMAQAEIQELCLDAGVGCTGTVVVDTREPLPFDAPGEAASQRDALTTVTRAMMAARQPVE